VPKYPEKPHQINKKKFLLELSLLEKVGKHFSNPDPNNRSNQIKNFQVYLTRFRSF
jgi:hypothetical protein